MTLNINYFSRQKNIEKDDDDILAESLTRSVIAISREKKLQRIIGGFAIQIAKQKNDPMYRKLIRFRRAWKAMSKALNQKYRGPATLAARQAILRHKEKTK